METPEEFSKNFSLYKRDSLLSEGMQEVKEYREGKNKDVLSYDHAMFQMTTLFELDNATLLAQGVSQQYKALVTDLTKKFQAEHECTTTAEKTIAHVAALNFIRVMEIQRHYNNELNASTYTSISLRRIEYLGKEYERVYRQYLSCIQSLRSLKQPPVNVIIKTTHANIGNQQLIQDNINVEPK